MDQKYAALFASMTLPVKPAAKVDGASIDLIEEPLADEETAETFFGGYAEGGLLDDMGFEAVDTTTADVAAARKPQ